jgi:hypothetical protein
MSLRLELHYDQEADEVTVCCKALNIYGCGGTVYKAMSMFAEEFTSLDTDLSEKQDRFLGKSLREVKKKLNNFYGRNRDESSKKA